MSGSVGNLYWRGGGSGIWDTGTSASWFNQATGSADVCYNGDSVTFDDSAGTANGAVTISGGTSGTVQPGSLTVNNTAVSYTFSGAAIAGRTGLLKSGPGELTLASSNAYSGGTSISGGVLNAVAANALGSGPLTLSGGTLSANAAQSVSSVALNGGVLAFGASGAPGSGGISFGGGTLQYAAGNTTDYSNRFSSAENQAYSVDTNGQSVTWGGILTSNGGSVIKSGNGVLTLVGSTPNPGPTVYSNSYTGGTVISGGTLHTAITGTLGAGSGAVSVGAAAALDLGETWQTTGAVNLAGGIIANGTLSGSSYNVASGTISAVLSGSGGLSKTGGGALTISGASTYSGGTTLAAGMIVVSSNGTPGISVPAGYTIAAAGDSITMGYYDRDGYTVPSWAATLQTLLGSQFNVQNYGVNGSSTGSYIGTTLCSQALAANPNVVVIQLGTNDTTFTQAQINANYATNLTAIVNAFKATANKPAIYLCLPPEIYGSGNGFIWPQNEANMDLILPLIQQVATATGATVIDNHTPFESEPQLEYDGLHPDTVGQQWIGQNVYPSLAATFFNNGPLGTGLLTLSGGTLSDDGAARRLTNSLAITNNTTFASTGSGSLTFDPAGLATPSTVTLSNNPTLTVNNQTTIKQAIGGSGFTLAGSGMLTLGASNSFGGVTATQRRNPGLEQSVGLAEQHAGHQRHRRVDLHRLDRRHVGRAGGQRQSGARQHRVGRRGAARRQRQRQHDVFRPLEWRRKPYEDRQRLAPAERQQQHLQWRHAGGGRDFDRDYGRRHTG